jgi:hypothetical protein
MMMESLAFNNVHYRGVNGQFHISAALSLENSLQYPLDRKMGGAQSRYERKDKTILPLPGIESRVLVSTSRSVVAIPIELS